MILYLIGIDYKNTPLSLREPIYRFRGEIIDFWQSKGQERAALFTCNRIELYGISENIFKAAGTISIFREKFPWIFERSYVKQGNEEVVEHALRLACGLESQILGEREISHQLNLWISERAFPWILRKIWGEILNRAEDIRFKSGLKGAKTNIAAIIFKDLAERAGAGRQKEIVVVGTGKIAQIFSDSKPVGINLHFAARKKHKRATKLAKRSGGKALLLDDLPGLLLAADALVSATSSPHHVLKKEYLSGILRKRKSRLYLYDLAVPRDIEPIAIDKIFLQNLDDLKPVFEQHNKALDSCIKRAELLILHHIFEIAGQVKEKSNAFSY